MARSLDFPLFDCQRDMTTELSTDENDLPDRRTAGPSGQMLAMGQLVAFPTETVYGLGANALDEQAVARIFEAKGGHPTIHSSFTLAVSIS